MIIDLTRSTEDAELRRTLQSLACGKKRVILKQPAGKDVNDGDLFVFNENFEDERPLVHINSVQSKETVRIHTYPIFPFLHLLAITLLFNQIP